MKVFQKAGDKNGYSYEHCSPSITDPRGDYLAISKHFQKLVGGKIVILPLPLPFLIVDLKPMHRSHYECR